MELHPLLGAQGRKRTRRRLRRRQQRGHTARASRLRGVALLAILAIYVHGCPCWLRFLLPDRLVSPIAAKLVFLLRLTGHPRCKLLHQAGSLLGVAHQVQGGGAAAALRRGGGCLPLSLPMGGLWPGGTGATFE